MATSRSFNTLLNDYLTVPLLKEEFLKRQYVIEKIVKNTGWKGGDLPVPFRGAHASSLKWGGLTSASSIADSAFVRGALTAQKELWGTMQFHSRDLQEHDGKIPETTFLRLLPDEVEDFTDYMKTVVAQQISSGGPHFAKGTANGQSDGTITVDKIDRFTIGQEVVIDDDDSNSATVYVIGVNLNSKTVTFSDTRGGSAYSITGYSLAQNVKFYHPGGTSASDVFTSMRQAYLSYANSGDLAIAGQTKTAYPILQAYNHDGSGMNETNVLDTIFDAMTQYRARARGAKANTALMSYKHLGSIQKQLEVQKGPFRQVADTKVSAYDWTEIQVMSVKGPLTLVGIQEMDDDIIPIVDWMSMEFATNGFFKKQKTPEGLEYFTDRATTGYKFIVDISLTGDVVYKKPSNNAIIYSIPNY